MFENSGGHKPPLHPAADAHVLECRHMGGGSLKMLKNRHMIFEYSLTVGLLLTV